MKKEKEKEKEKDGKISSSIKNTWEKVKEKFCEILAVIFFLAALILGIIEFYSILGIIEFYSMSEIGDFVKLHGAGILSIIFLIAAIVIASDDKKDLSEKLLSYFILTCLLISLALIIFIFAVFVYQGKNALDGSDPIIFFQSFLVFSFLNFSVFVFKEKVFEIMTKKKKT